MTEAQPRLEPAGGFESPALLAALLRRQTGRDWTEATPAQRRIWFMEQIVPGTPTYNLPAAFRVHGDLDVPALDRALVEIVRRHAPLRTVFRRAGGTVMQTPGPVPDAVLAFGDADAGGLLAAVTDEARRPFDLAGGRLLRARLIRADAEPPALIVTLHHIAADGWSMGLLVGELQALYDALHAGRPPPLADPPVTYADHADRLRREADSPANAQALAYWRDTLAGAPPVLALPTDRDRPGAPYWRGARHAVRLLPDRWRAVEAGARRLAATPFMVLLAAFQYLLASLAGQRDVVVGTVAANRRHADVEGLIGLFIELLPIRLRLAGAATVRDLVARVREAAVGALAHQAVPFDRIVQDLVADRRADAAPLVQALLVFQNRPVQAAALAGVRLDAMPVDTGAAPFDLSLYVLHDADGATLTFEYSTDLFDAGSVARLADGFLTVLEAVLADPDRRLDTVALTGSDERAAVAALSAGPAAPPPEAPDLAAAFARVAARRPQAPALLDDAGRTVAYAELDRRADGLAARLAALGVRAERPVGVLAVRSADLVAALLAVLKAGGAFVPLDPAYPRPWLEAIADDAGLDVVLCDAAHDGWLPGAGRLWIRLDDSGPAGGPAGAPAGGPVPPPGAAAGPDGLAYVLFTSGSTGRPKGVMATHRGALNRFQWMWRAYPFAPDERCLHHVPLNFVDAVWDLFGPLLAGTPIVLAPPGLDRDPQRFAAMVAGHRITRLVTVPSVLAALLDQPDAAGQLASLRLVVSSGETLPAPTVRAFRERLPGARLLNLYGSSEVAADVGAHEVGADDAAALRVPVGRPIDNTRLFVLDRAMRRLPRGAWGELYAGGPGLARCYLGSPALTAERFVPDPFGPPGSRLFRTGDVARWRPDGLLELGGRRDRLVKLGGVRIDLGHVEQVLRDHAGVADACVLAAPGPSGDDRLVACVAARGGAAVDSAELRGHLRARLPGPMVPAAIVPLDRLPRLVNGKLDRRALQAAAAEADAARPIAEPPASDLERRIAAVWADVLGVPAVGATDNFFDAGGTSIMLIRLQARLAKHLERAVDIVDLFRAPTVRGLAGVLSAPDGAADAAPREAEAIGRAGLRRRLAARRARAAAGRGGPADA